MRIGIDGHNLAMPYATGVGTYGVVLANLLKGAGHRIEGVFGIDTGGQPTLREVMFFDRLGRHQELTLRERAAIGLSMLKPLPRRLDPVPVTGLVDLRQIGSRLPLFDAFWTLPHLFELAYARFFALGAITTVRVPNPPDVMHWTYPLPIRMAGTRNIYTLHDLVPLRLPHTTLDDKRYYWQLIARTLKHADHIVTVSQSSRNDILSTFDVAPDKVTNTYQASPAPTSIVNTTAEEDAATVLSTFGLAHRGFYLFFGAVDPKKNITRIIDAYLSARSDLKLVMIQSRSWGLEKQETHMLDGGRVYGQDLGDRVQTLDYLPRATLFRLIRSARAVLCPSLYEGFGLPALEAIEMGTPVISSDVSALPEVVGDAGLLVDPYDTQAIAGAIRAMEDDATYARLLAAGPAQAAKFTSEAYLQRLRAMYGKLGLAI